MSFFGFGQSADIQIILNNEDKLRTTKVKLEDGKIEKRFLFYDGEPIEGEVVVKLKKANQKLEHYGIKIEFIGLIETFYDRNNQNEFISLKRDLATAGEILQQNTRFNFSFLNVEKPYESYIGNNVKLRYFLRVTIVKKFSDIIKELDIAVHTLSTYPERNTNIKMEVGIEDCLHIEFEYNNSRYHLKDVIVGKIYFLLVRIKIKYMEIAIVKQEVVGNGASTFRENETLAKYEIMDGSPVKGESIPIRLFLNGYDLTPTLKDVVDEEDRRYYKQHEITLWRKVDEELRKKNFTQNGGERITDSNPPIIESISNDIKNNHDEIIDDDEEGDNENPTSTL